MDLDGHEIADEYIVTAERIFEFCGADSTLCVDVLMDKFAPFVKRNKTEYSYLRSLLDPHQSNPEITVSKLATTLSKYSESQKTKVDLDESFNNKSGLVLQDSDSGISSDGFQLLEELQCELREKSQLLQQLRRQLGDCEALHEEALASAAAERSALQEQLNTLREENGSLNHVRRDYEDVCERLCAGEKTLDEARAQLEGARKRARDLAERVEHLETERQSLTELLSRSKAECHRINEKYASRQSALLERDETLRRERAELQAAADREQRHLQRQLQRLHAEKILLEMELKDVLNKSDAQLRPERSVDVSYTDDQILSALDSLHADCRHTAENRLLDEESFVNALKEDQGRPTNLSLFDEIRLSFCNVSRHGETDLDVSHTFEKHSVDNNSFWTVATQTERGGEGSPALAEDETRLHTAVQTDEDETRLHTAVQTDEDETRLHTAVQTDEDETRLHTAVQTEEDETRLHTAVQTDEDETRLHTAVQTEEDETRLHTAVQTDEDETRLHTAVQTEEDETRLHTAVQTDEDETRLHTAVQTEEDETRLHTAVQTDEDETRLHTAVQTEEDETRLHTAVQTEEDETRLHTAVQTDIGPHTLYYKDTFYLSPGDKKSNTSTVSTQIIDMFENEPNSLIDEIQNTKVNTVISTDTALRALELRRDIEVMNFGTQTDIEEIEPCHNNNNVDTCMDCTRCIECDRLNKYATKLEGDINKSNIIVEHMQRDMSLYEENLNLLKKFVAEGNERNTLLKAVVERLRAQLGALGALQGAATDDHDPPAAQYCDGSSDHVQTDCEPSSVWTQTEAPPADCGPREPHRGLRRYLCDSLRWLLQLFAVVCFSCAVWLLGGVTGRACPPTPGPPPATSPWWWMHVHELLDMLLTIEYVAEVPM